MNQTRIARDTTFHLQVLDDAGHWRTVFTDHDQQLVIDTYQGLTQHANVQVRIIKRVTTDYELAAEDEL